MQKEKALRFAQAAAPWVVCFGLYAVCAFAQSPMDNYAPEVESWSKSRIVVACFVIAFVVAGIMFAMRSHEMSKATLSAMIFGLILAASAATLVARFF